MGRIRVGQRGTSTRTAREIQRSVTRWLGGLAAMWVAVAVCLGLAVSREVAWVLVPAGMAGALAIVATGVAARRIRASVERLDEERHGLREAYDRARLDALRDGLTGLGNHRAFQEELEEQAMIARQEERPLALLLVDVDDLKKVNDAGGHAAGDELLRATARIIAGNLRRGDRGFRIGGDEFAILLVDCSADEAVAISRRLLASALSAGSGTLGVEPFSVTIGVSALPQLAAGRQQLAHQADAALYWGKRHGRTDVQLFDPAHHGMADDGRSLEELTSAVTRVAADRLLAPVYQPIYSLRTGRVLGFEGLVRPRPDSGFASASALFVAAEATGRTVELDLASLETVLMGARGLDDELYLSVNLSPRSLEADAFRPSELLAIARRWGLANTRLVVELTEREVVEDLGRLRAALAFLHRHGVRIAADDVGAGNAGLRLLSELEFDVMKIDLSLVRAGARTDPADAVLRALRELARRRRQSIVAEGVETPAELQAIMALGFDSAQGYLLGRPSPALDAPQLDLARATAEAEPAGEPSTAAAAG